MGQCRWGAAANDGRRFVHERIILQGSDHEQCKIDAPRLVARKNRVSDMLAPNRQALTLTFLEIASTNDGPPGVAGEDATACFDLVEEDR